jgi:hypothetical protein
MGYRSIQGQTYASCRTGPRHDWDEVPVTRRPSFGVAVWWRCTKCTTLRKFIYSIDGEVISRQYTHPKDWAKLPRKDYTTQDINKMYLAERRKEQAQLRRKKK